ncbi:hypothetical protein L9F63_021332, partial [Diploptera punctata]
SLPLTNQKTDITQRTELPVSRQPLRMPDAVSGETSGNYKPHDHGLQPENLLQDHHSVKFVKMGTPLQSHSIRASIDV